MQASQIAKFKTFLQFGAVGWVVFPLTTDIDWLADSFLWAGVAVAWISAAQYVARRLPGHLDDGSGLSAATAVAGRPPSRADR